MYAKSSPAEPAKRSGSHQRHRTRSNAGAPAKTPFAGPGPAAAIFFYSRDRRGEHPERHLAGFAGMMQADAYAGFNRLYEADRKPAFIIELSCWAHARRKFFDLARISKAPIGAEACASDYSVPIYFAPVRAAPIGSGQVRSSTARVYINYFAKLGCLHRGHIA
jgi:hypothetical protein